MHKVSRSLLLAGVLAFGTLTAACGDKVELTQVNPNTGVTAITVTPSNATIAAGSTIQLASSVTADANTAKTVTWSTSSAAVATVDATGKVTGVAAGTATIIATSTADNSKAAAAAITVTGNGTVNTPNTVAISTINQGGAPAILNNVFGQLDVTLFISGPAGTLNLIQNCGNGDVIVASQQVAGSQLQSPVTLSYNTAGTGTITPGAAGAAGTAVYNNNASTPIAINGNCVLKAQLGSATATQITPITLNNANLFRTVVSFNKTTAGGTQNAISAASGLRFDQGDVKVELTPVVFTTASGATTAQVPATASVSYAGKTAQTVAFTGGKFTATFASTGTPSAANISQYTSPATVAGDAVVVTAYTDAAGQGVTLGSAVVATGIRSDNQSPTSGPALSQALNLFTSQRNYINGAYSFATNNTPQTDVAFAASQLTTSFWVGALPAGAAYPSTLQTSGTNAGCSTTGLTKVTTGADLAQTVAPYGPNYFVRVIEMDPLGNLICQDFGTTNGIAGFGVDLQAPNAVTVTAGTNGSNTNNSVITTNATNTFFSVDSVSGFNPGSELRTSVVRNFSAANCVVGTGASCAQVSTGYSVNIDQGSNTQGYYTVTTMSRDQAGNVSPTLTRTYLLDFTPPTVGGIQIPQNLVGGAPVTFLSQASDNVDLQSSSFDLTYSAASGGAVLWYPGDNYGPNYDAQMVTSAPLNATVPFFIKQLQGTAGGAPVAFAAGIGADSGRATQVTVRALDAANLLSNNSFALLPAINIANSTGFTTEFSTFTVTNAAANVSNGTGTGTKTATLVAQAILNSATPQTANLPFAQVCFFYQQTAAGNAANPSIPTGDLVSLGCVGNPDIADVPNTSRTWTYRMPGFDPVAGLGTAGTINIFAVGVNTAGVGIISAANANITLIN